jgi:hypothetical protein
MWRMIPEEEKLDISNIGLFSGKARKL